MHRLGARGELLPVLEPPENTVRRQDLPPIYVLNGAIYVADVAELRKSRSFVTCQTVGYMMPAERSIDIDTAADFEAARASMEG
jgi:CMP-N,N'-diacetyllegionaminic acid synthase